MCRIGSKLHEFPNRSARLLSCSQFQYLPEQHQGDDHRRGFKIERWNTVLKERLWYHTRKQHDNQTEQIRRQCSHGDQREHVQVHRAKRLGSANQQGPSAPKHNRRRQRQLQPTKHRLAHPIRDPQSDHRPHRDHEQWHRQRDANPKATLHVGVLIIFTLVIQRDDLRLQVHPTNRAVAGADLLDFRVHRAGVDRRRVCGRIARLGR